MKNESLGFLPRSRQEGIITKEVEDELLIYDSARDRAHCLNPLAAAIWKLCDGRTTPIEITRKLAGRSCERQVARAERKSSRNDQRGLSSTNRESTSFQTETNGSKDREIDVEVVWLALAELRRSNLLEEFERGGEWPSTILGMSRREAIRRIGLGATITLPIVISMTAPTAVEAAVSCKARCQPCVTGDCCSGVCASSVPGCPGSGNKCA